MKAKRLKYIAKNTALIENCAVESSDNAIVIKTAYSGISRGTESLVFNGLVPASEHERMRCPHQTGEFTFPVSYGYACVGEIETVGSSVSEFKSGDLVFSLHPHQSIFAADPQFCTKLPLDIDLKRACLAANMETALNAVWDSELPKNANICVIGAGIVGLLTAYVAQKISGKTVTVIDINTKRKKQADILGLNFLMPHMVRTENIGQFNRLVNTSASEKGLQLALDLADFEARITEMSWYGDKQVSLNLGGSFHSKRLQIISSQVGHISPSKRDTTTHAMRMTEALSYLNDEKLNCLLEPEIAFEELPDHLHELFSDKSDALCQVVTYKSD